MAKVSRKKKRNYRLKRTVRRSIAAVFLITAIVLAAIPVPDVAADEEFDTSIDGYGVMETSLSGNSIAYPSEAEITNMFGPTKYANTGQPVHKTYEIQQNNDGTYKKIWVYEIWLDPDNGIDKGVICNFNSQYNPTNGILKIPNNVITEFQSFVMSNVEQALPGYDEIRVNAFFGIVPVEKPVDPDDPSSGTVTELPDKHYKLESGKWIDPNSLTEITANEKRALYMDITLSLPKSEWTAREVITGTGAGGNTYEYIPYNENDKTYKKTQDYSINAIGDNAFYDPVAGAKANHISNLELQIVNDVVAIGNEAFRGAATLQKVTIGANVKDIGARAFKECTGLKEVSIIAGNKTVGVEAFSGCNSLPTIKLESTFERMDFGAFSNCLSLNTVDMSASTISGVKVGAFSFYNCPNLKNVSFAQNTDEIGDGCFAVVSPQDSLEVIEFPQRSQALKALGKGMFDGQSKLKKVTMPLNFGYSPADEMTSVLDSGFFFKCTNLEEVIFPEECKYANFPADIFATVENPNFKVVGPATLSMSDPTYARPRTSAHEANVPYQYQENGRTYLELRKANQIDGTYNFYRIDDANQLISFESTADEIDLEIFDKIGNFPLKGIQDGCFKQEMKDKLRSINIYDNSIETIADNTFSNSPILEDVHIGNTVQKIGANAFLNCPNVTKITFSSPNFSHENMVIGTDAFKTNSSELVLQGDIVPNYAPFTWAMSDASVLDDYGKRVCYKSNAPQNLTVIRDNVTGLATLVDYPHFENIDEDNADYKQRLIDNYVKAGATDGIIRPIIEDASYIENKLRVTLGEPTVAGSSWNPTDDPWYKVTTEEQQMYDSIVNIVIPAGIQSIDSRTFFDPGSNTDVISNKSNWSYVPTTKSNKYYEYDDTAIVPLHGGLFSGDFVEYGIAGTNDKEKVTNGNDRIKTISMSEIQYFPDYAFESCENLEKVTFSDTLTKMGLRPFAGCNNLTDVSSNKTFETINKIIYSNKADGTKNIVQCLPNRGLKTVTEKEISGTTDSTLSLVTSISEGAFKECPGIAEVDLTVANKLTTIPKDCFYNCEELANVTLPDSIRAIAEGAFKKAISALNVVIPVKQINIADNAFEHNQGTITTFTDSSAWDYAGMWNIRQKQLKERYKVTFLDADGNQLDVQMVEAGKDAEPPVPPERKGYKFKEWSGSYKNILADITLFAKYEPTSNKPSDPSNPGGNNGNNGNNGSVSGNETENGKKYKVTVTNGSGSGEYTSGTIVNITANASAEKKIFDKWTTSSAGTYFANYQNVTTSFVMPKNDVTVVANYKSATVSNNKTSSGNKTNSGNSTSTSRPKTNTVITITKPGFSNTDKANAIVTGSTDNFVVKVTESAEAQRLVQEALINSDLTMDTIRYFPMDISLYDSTGTIPVLNTSGLTVSITMPLPDELRQYGGNNKVACVVDGTLEQLRPKFSTIDKVPCVTFTATHFSPYTIYVDTENLIAGDITDANPKTGDGIHPKWFLVIGLVAASAVLFLKKDKKVALG